MEATLALTVNELEGRIGAFLGFGRGAANGDPAWTARGQALVDSSRRSGLRAFYTASAGQEDGSQGYQWSFLRPLVSLPFVLGTSTVMLPEDYHGLEGRLTVTSPNSQVFRPVPVVGIGLIQEQYSKLPNFTGWPQMAAIQPLKNNSAIKGQRFQLYLFPLADQAYTLQFTYWINCNDIDTQRPYPYGGAQHSETIIAACLASAEQEQDDMAGVMTNRFQSMLAGSINVDRRNKPQLTGYCGDRSDHPQVYGDRLRDVYENDAVTYAGVSY